MGGVGHARAGGWSSRAFQQRRDELLSIFSGTPNGHGPHTRTSVEP